MSAPSVESTLRQYLVDELGLPSSITEESALAESGMLVSAQLLDLVVFVEETFDVVLRPVDVLPEKMRSIRTIADVIRERVADAGR